MEVLPCSTVHYVGEFNGEPNCLEHEDKVQGSDGKVDDKSLNSNGKGNGVLYFDVEVDCQKYTTDSHDSEDEILNELDFSKESLLASETAHVIMDSCDGELTGDNKEGEYPVLETGWLEHDGAVAVWVKWRGKWQAGIKCARADWPLPMLKAKPTHDQKKYVVIFFPRTRNYSWADVLLLRPIHEFPEPIVYKTHKFGLKLMKDLTLPCRFIIQKLGLGVVNIIDRLQTQALAEAARDVKVWKEFAAEASGCKCYSDLGRMLLKLQNMILQSYFRGDWVEQSLHSWMQRCHNADSAQSVEMLKEELVDSIEWDKISLLSNVPLQPNLVSEWKNLKNEVMKCFSTSDPSPTNAENTLHPTNESPLASGFQLNRKRPKLEVRRADSHSTHIENLVSGQVSTVEIDAGFFDGRGNENENASSLEEVQVEGSAIGGSPASVAERWGEIVIEHKDVTPVSGGEVKKRSSNFGNKTRQCQAYIEAKGRQCVRWANDGSDYCCVHLASRFGGNSVKKETFDGRGIENASSLKQIQVEGRAIGGSPASVADRSGEIVMENRDATPANGGEVKKRSSNFGNKTRQCQVFIEAKGRQCVRWANDGSDYCCVHLASRFGGHSVKQKASTPVDLPLCNGTTVLNTKCKHRALSGFPYCKKHRPRDDMNAILPSPNKKLKRDYGDVNRSSVANLLMENGEAPLEVDPISYMGIGIVPSSGKGMTKYGDNEVKHCIGSCNPEADDSCLESPNKLGLYCEKHLPSWLKRARNGKSRIVTKEVFLDLLKDCRTLEQKIHLHRACDLFYSLFKSILSMRNPVPREVQFQWVITEASKDVRVGEILMKLVRSEIDRLRMLWGFDADKDVQNLSFIEEFGADSKENNVQNTIRCKLCSGHFADDQTLGGHWIDKHKREAQWLFRGYVCAICLDSFTNKKGLETHVQEKHHVEFADQSMLLQCIPCGGHFGNPDQLWLHVLSVHSANLRFSEDGQYNEGHDSLQKLDIGNLASIVDKTSDGSRRYICKFCGLKFDLLPDLGRHHQAAHRGASSIIPRAPRKGIHFYAYRLKSGRLTRPSFRKGLGTAANRIRKRATASIKKRILATRVLGNNDMNAQSSIAEDQGLGRLAESECLSVAKILFSEIHKTKPRPSNFEILSVARSACCRVSLQALLEEKYGNLPEHLYLKAAKLCSERNILVEWHKDGYICPKGCKLTTDGNLPSSLETLMQDFKGRRSSNTEDLAKDEWEMDECHYVIDSSHFKKNPVPRSFVLCDDISFGKESVPIICIVDEDLLDSLQIVRDCSDDKITAHSMPWEDFTYVKKPLLGESLTAEVQILQLGRACTNSSTCSPETCDHVYLFDNDYESANDVYGKPMLGRFPYDENGRLVLEEGYLVYECNNKCSCSKACPNRILQNGVRVRLEVFKTEKKGWGVRAQEPILRGTFVCELIGEVIDEQEADKRRNSDGGDQGWGYHYNIDAQTSNLKRLIEEPVPYTIDCMKYGNVSRYINHSCSPNLVSRQVLVESMDCQLMRVGFFASQDIAAGEELTYDYCYKLEAREGHSCYCGSSNCRGRLY